MFISYSFFVAGSCTAGGVDVTGTVIEEGNNEPIEQATVRLLNVKDSTMIGGVASSRNGNFTLKGSRPAVIYCMSAL